MTELPQTTQSFLDQLAGHDNDAWSIFLNVYGAAIHAHCIRLGLQDSEANDVRQDVIVAVEKQLTSGRHDPNKGTFRGWIFGVSRNLIKQTIRKRDRLIATGSSGFLKVLENMESPESELSGDEFDLEYQRQLFKWAASLVKQRVNESSWQAFWRTTIDGTPSTEVAEDLGMTIGAVYTAKCRVITHLQKLLQEIPDGIKEIPDRFDLPTVKQPAGESFCDENSDQSSRKERQQ